MSHSLIILVPPPHLLKLLGLLCSCNRVILKNLHLKQAIKAVLCTKHFTSKHPTLM